MIQVLKYLDYEDTMNSYLPIINRKIRVAVVGCGRISKNHLDSIEKFKDDLDLVALCDVNKSTLDLAINHYNVAGYSDFESMLDLADESHQD